MKHNTSTLSTVLIACFLFLSNCARSDQGELISAPEQDLENAPMKVRTVAQLVDNPVDFADPGTGPKRAYICEQKGEVQILDLEKEKLKETAFLDIKDQVTTGYELGLLSLRFHPNYEENRKFYTNYTTTDHGEYQTVVSEWKANKDGTRALKDSEQILLKFKQPYGNHNGGQLAFGPDGMLYIGTGDGGAANDPGNNAQNKRNLLGKILRINVNKQGNDKNYKIPEDNPFTDNKHARGEIWAYGLRNPWRFSFDPVTGNLWAGDVGQNNREEINLIEKGKNYGWRRMEGSIFNPNISVKEDDTGLTGPIAEYRTNQQGTSVVGGYVYRGEKIPELQGYYVYGDYSSGNIWIFRYEDGTVKDHRRVMELSYTLSSFGVDREQELYLCTLNGEILKFEPVSE